MFYGPVKEEGDIKIVDASIGALKEFLQFFYTNDIQLTMENVAYVMNLGKKYEINECFNFCVKPMKCKVTPKNACHIYGIATFYELADLMRICEYIFRTESTAILKSNDFMECKVKMLGHILKMNYLSCPETVVFEACMAWIKSASQIDEITKNLIQTYLGVMFYQIRFRSMTYDEFVDFFPKYEMAFTANELIEILQMIRKPKYQPKLFNGSKRKLFNPNGLEAMKCNREMYRSNRGIPIQCIETTTFTTNKEVLLIYYKCVPVWNNNGHALEEDVTANVTIVRVFDTVQGVSNTVLYTGETKICRDQQYHEVHMLKPILICPEFEYQIRFNLQISEGVSTFRSFRKTEFLLDSDISVKFHRDTVVNGLVFGLVEELGFFSMN